MKPFIPFLVIVSFFASSIAIAQPIQDFWIDESLARVNDILARDHQVTRLIDIQLKTFEKKYGPINKFSRNWTIRRMPKAKYKQQKCKP